MELPCDASDADRFVRVWMKVTLTSEYDVVHRRHPTLFFLISITTSLANDNHCPIHLPGRYDVVHGRHPTDRGSKVFLGRPNQFHAHGDKNLFAVKSPIIETMISGDGLGCHGQWILRVPDHGSRDRLYFAHSSCLAVILSAGRHIVFFLLFCHCCCCCCFCCFCCCCPRDRLYLAHSSSVAVILGTCRDAQTFLILFVFVVVVRETVSISSTLLV